MTHIHLRVDRKEDGIKYHEIFTRLTLHQLSKSNKAQQVTNITLHSLYNQLLSH
jgi:hypothetical protein